MVSLISLNIFHISSIKSSSESVSDISWVFLTIIFTLIYIQNIFKILLKLLVLYSCRITASIFLIVFQGLLIIIPCPAHVLSSSLWFLFLLIMPHNLFPMGIISYFWFLLSLHSHMGNIFWYLSFIFHWSIIESINK